MATPDWLPDYGVTAFAALCGSVARGKSWTDLAGRVLMARVVTELATAVGLAMGVVAAGEYFHVDLKALIGLAVFSGWLGPAAVSDLVLSRFPALRPGGKG